MSDRADHIGLDREHRELIPSDLVARPSETARRPPVQTRVQELPFAELTWQNFERICYRVASLETDIEECRRYGREGQAQQGIDIYARRSDGQYDVWQCKRYCVVPPAHVTRSVDNFLDGSWAQKTKRLRLCVSVSLQDTALQEIIETNASRLSNYGIRFDVLDRVRLSELLKELPALVDDFFGRTWVTAFCGEDAVSLLAKQKRVLTGEEIVKLRTELSRFYNAYFTTLDRRIGHLSGNSLVLAGFPDLWARFVVPDVLVSTAVSWADRSMARTGGSDEREQDRQPELQNRRRSGATDVATESDFRRPVSLLQNSGAQERSRRRQVRTNRLVAFRRRIHRQDICGGSNRPESRAEAASLAVRGQICPVSPCRESADPAIGSWNEVGFSSAGVSTGPPSAPGCRTSGGTSPWRDRGRVSDGRRIRPSDGR